MPRYIDADALLENLKKQYGEELGWQCTVNMSDIGMMIEDAPAADVAPKSEAIKAYLAKVLEKKDTAWHYTPGTEVVTVDVLEHYARIMTEGKNDG